MTFNTNFHIRRPTLFNEHEPDNRDYYWLHKFFDHTVKQNNLLRAVLDSLSSNWYLWSTHTGCKKKAVIRQNDNRSDNLSNLLQCNTFSNTQCKPWFTFERLFFLCKNLEEIQNVTAIGVKKKLKRIETQIETQIETRIETRIETPIETQIEKEDSK